MLFQQKEKDLYLVDLVQTLPGFYKFISTWISTSHNRVVVVDPGPSSSIPLVEQALNELNLKHIDYILLTHIHIDHAGGTGKLMEKYPLAKVICHPKAVKHMIEPEKLWQGSLNILGIIAECYGPILPVPRDVISHKSQVQDGALKIDIFETPGHAVHHVCFLMDGILFSGEAAGVNFPLEKTQYLRIATPPQFIYEIYKDSLFKIANLDCNKICFGHFDSLDNPEMIFNNAKAQLELWMDITGKYHFEDDYLDENTIFQNILEADPLMKPYLSFPDEIKKREKYFALNSIRGMIGYLDDQK